MLFDAQKGEKLSMFLASDVIKRHFGAHTESQESSLLPVAKYFACVSPDDAGSFMVYLGLPSALDLVSR